MSETPQTYTWIKSLGLKLVDESSSIYIKFWFTHLKHVYYMAIYHIYMMTAMLQLLSWPLLSLVLHNVIRKIKTAIIMMFCKCLLLDEGEWGEAAQKALEGLAPKPRRDFPY